MIPERLYAEAHVYRSVFGDADTQEESDFYRILTSTDEQKPLSVLDLGSGPSALSARIASTTAVALDIEPTLLTEAGKNGVLPLCADIVHPAGLPFASGSFHACISHLFGIAYAFGTLWERNDMEQKLLQTASEVGRILIPGGKIAFDIPLAHIPGRLAGLSETMTLPDGSLYTFFYLETLRHVAAGNVLDTIIRVETQEKSPTVLYELSAPLFVFTPQGARDWLASAGFHNIAFSPLGDAHTVVERPPEDCLRAIITATRP